jgi:hypothetical protein
MLGDMLSKALGSVGVTEERVSAFLGRPCRCRERRERLNRLTSWAIRVVSGKATDAKKHLDDILGDGPR